MMLIRVSLFGLLILFGYIDAAEDNGIAECNNPAYQCLEGTIRRKSLKCWKGGFCEISGKGPNATLILPHGLPSEKKVVQRFFIYNKGRRQYMFADNTWVSRFRDTVQSFRKHPYRIEAQVFSMLFQQSDLEDESPREDVVPMERSGVFAFNKLPPTRQFDIHVKVMDGNGNRNQHLAIVLQMIVRNSSKEEMAMSSTVAPQLTTSAPAAETTTTPESGPESTPEPDSQKSQPEAQTESSTGTGSEHQRTAEEIAGCSTPKYKCIEGTITRKSLKCSEGVFCKISGDGPNATLILPHGLPSERKMVKRFFKAKKKGSDKYSMFMITERTSEFRYILKTFRKEPYRIESQVLSMLFQQPDLDDESPREDVVPMERSGLFAFNKLPAIRQFEIHIEVKEENEKGDPNLAIVLDMVVRNSSEEETAMSSTVAPQLTTLAPAAETTTMLESDSQTTSQPEAQTESGTETGSKHQMTAEEIAECEKHFCIVGKLIRTTLTTHPNNLVEVTGDGPNATLTLPHGLPFELKKYIAFYTRGPDGVRRGYNHGTWGNIGMKLMISRSRPVRIETQALNMLFQQSEPYDETPREDKVPMEIEGVFAFDPAPKFSGNFEFLISISEIDDTPKPDLLMVLSVVSETASDETTLAPTESEIGTTSQAPTESEMETTSAAPTESEIETTSEAPTTSGNETTESGSESTSGTQIGSRSDTTKSDSQTTPQPEGPTESGTVTEAQRELTDREKAGCGNWSRCIEGTIRRVFLRCWKGRFCKKSGDGPNATLIIPHGIPAARKKVVCYLRYKEKGSKSFTNFLISDSTGRLRNTLQSFRKEPYSIEAQVLSMLFQQSDLEDESPREDVVPMERSGLFTFNRLPETPEFKIHVEIKDESGNGAPILAIILEMVARDSSHEETTVSSTEAPQLTAEEICHTPKYKCIEGTIRRKSLKCSEGGFCEISGDGPNATLILPHGVPPEAKKMKCYLRYEGEGRKKAIFNSDSVGPLRNTLQSFRKEPYRIESQVLSMLFQQPDLEDESPREDVVPMERSGLFAFKRLPATRQFEIHVDIDIYGRSQLAIVLDMVVGSSSQEETTMSSTVAPQLTTWAPAAETTIMSEPGPESTPEPDSQTTSQPEAQTESGTETGSKHQMTAEEIAECEKHFCVVGKLIRTTLTTHPNNLVEVTGDGPNATLTLPHGLPFELKKYIAFYTRGPDGVRRGYNHGTWSNIGMKLMISRSRPVRIETQALNMLFQQSEPYDETPREDKVPMEIEGVFAFDPAPKFSGNFEFLISISEIDDTPKPDLLMVLSVVSETASDETTFAPTESEIGTTSQAPTESEIGTTSEAPTESEMETTSAAPTESEIETTSEAPTTSGNETTESGSESTSGTQIGSRSDTTKSDSQTTPQPEGPTESGTVTEAQRELTDREKAGCGNWSRCIEGTIRRVFLRCWKGRFCKKSGDGPNATLIIPHGIPATRKKVVCYLRYFEKTFTNFPISESTGRLRNILQSFRKEPYRIEAQVLSMLFQQSDLEDESPREDVVPMERSGLFAFNRLPPTPEFRIHVEIKDESGNGPPILAIIFGIVARDSSHEETTVSSTVAPQLTTSAPTAETTTTPESGPESTPEPDSQTTSQPEAQTESSTETGSKSRMTAEEIAECEKHFCIVGKLIRTTLTTQPNNLVEVTGDGPNATLTLPHGLPFELDKYIAFYTRGPNGVRRGYNHRTYGNIGMKLMISRSRPVRIETQALNMLFQQSEPYDETPREDKVPMEIEGVFAFDPAPKFSGNFEFLISIRENDTTPKPDLLMVLSVVSETASDETTLAPTESEIGTTSEAPTESETETTSEAPTESEMETTSEAPTENETETTSEAPTGSETETTSEAPTESETETTSEAPTESETETTSEAPTESEMETTSEAPTENETETTSEAPTGSETETTSEAPTESDTETTSEAPTESETETTSVSQTESLPYPEPSPDQVGRIPCHYYNWLRTFGWSNPNISNYYDWLLKNGCLTGWNYEIVPVNLPTTPAPAPVPQSALLPVPGSVRKKEPRNPKCHYYKWLREFASANPTVREYFNWLLKNKCFAGISYSINGLNSGWNNTGNAKDSPKSFIYQGTNSRCHYFNWLRNFGWSNPSDTDYYDWLLKNHCLVGGNYSIIPVNLPATPAPEPAPAPEPQPEPSAPQRALVPVPGVIQEIAPVVQNCLYSTWLRQFKSSNPTVDDYYKWLVDNNCIAGAEYASLGVSADQKASEIKGKYAEVTARPVPAPVPVPKEIAGKSSANPDCNYMQWLRKYGYSNPTASAYYDWQVAKGCIPGASYAFGGTKSAGQFGGNFAGGAAGKGSIST